MNITIGNYKLSSSSNDFTVSEIKTIEKGDKTGEIYESGTSYHPTLESAINSVFKRRLLISDATTLKALIEEVRAHREELRTLFNQLI